jgi:hypothetical protein
MPLRYSNGRLKILKSVAALQKRGALDETQYRNFLRKYGKALRQLQRLEDKAIASPDFMSGGREFHPERERDAISIGGFSMRAEDLQTLLFEHGTDAYNKLVRGAKIISPLF